MSLSGFLPVLTASLIFLAGPAIIQANRSSYLCRDAPGVPTNRPLPLPTQQLGIINPLP